MSKHFKLKFPSINIPSFQFCRSKSPNSLPKNPKPANYRRSPVSPAAFDITFPSSPAPPPATPEYTYVSRSKSTKKIRSSSDGCDRSRRSRSCGGARCSEVPCCTVETETSEKYFRKEKKKKKKKSNNNNNNNNNTPAKSSHVFTPISSDDDDDSLALLDSSISFSSEKFPATVDFAARRRWSPPKTTSSRDETAERRVGESVAVVKKSEDPYEDFKRSMLEMIMEKQMFQASELEELLQCFLSLNSRQYHGLIVEAFSDIWEILFSHSSNAKHPAFHLQ